MDDPATPVTNEGDAPETGTAADFAKFKGHLQLSRFKLAGDTLELDTEEKILEVPVDRGICCHVGGNIDFDGVGNLFLSHGRRHEPVRVRRLRADRRLAQPQPGVRRPAQRRQHERPARQDPADPARRTAAATRSRSGNLFRAGHGEHQARDLRDGPAQPVPVRGQPQERRRLRRRLLAGRRRGQPAARPGGPRPLDADQASRRTIGWPYCVTPTLPYIDYDFATKTSGEAFNCNAPTNDSPYNTGLKRLPSVTQPDVWYSYDESPLFPELGPEGTPGGIAPMGGPAYDPVPGNSSPFRFPNYFKGVPLFYEWSRDYIKEFRLNGRKLGEIRPFSVLVDNPMDMEYGPDGALYVLEYGDGYFAENPDAQLAKINFVRGNHTPVVKVAATSTAGRAPLDGHVLQRGHRRPGRRPDRLRVGLRVRRQGRLDRGQPDVQVREQRHLPREAARSPTARAAARPPRSRCWSATPSRWSS